MLKAAMPILTKRKKQRGRSTVIQSTMAIIILQEYYQRKGHTGIIIVKYNSFKVKPLILKYMLLDISRIRKIKEEMSDIFSIINKPRLYSDYDRYYFLCSEFETLICVLNLLELRAYKESFVLLRTVFEKFLYFWLMLEGNRYRWTVTYNIQPIVSKTPKEARDNTIEHSNAEMKSGNTKLKDVIQIQAGSADQEMNVTFESEGLYERGDVSHTEPLIPIYNFILREYQPDFAHVPPIEKLKEGTIPSETLLEQIKLQKRYYHNLIYIDKIIRKFAIY
jgi:hypothetical protein